MNKKDKKAFDDMFRDLCMHKNRKLINGRLLNKKHPLGRLVVVVPMSDIIGELNKFMKKVK